MRKFYAVIAVQRLPPAASARRAFALTASKKGAQMKDVMIWFAMDALKHLAGHIVSPSPILRAANHQNPARVAI